MEEDVLIVRIYLSEADGGRRTNLMREIVQLLHDQHRVRGLTVFRGIAGFGTSGEVHAADLLHLTADLPLVIEFFDQPAAAQAAIALVQQRVPSNHIVAWPGSAMRRAPDS